MMPETEQWPAAEMRRKLVSLKYPLARCYDAVVVTIEEAAAICPPLATQSRCLRRVATSSRCRSPSTQIVSASLADQRSEKLRGDGRPALSPASVASSGSQLDSSETAPPMSGVRRGPTSSGYGARRSSSSPADALRFTRRERRGHELAAEVEWLEVNERRGLTRFCSHRWHGHLIFEVISRVGDDQTAIRALHSQRSWLVSSSPGR